MIESTDRRADTTRAQILRAAAQQFARRPFHEVGLDDILAAAELTKGAMYFHFRSKHALALAVIEEQLSHDRTALRDLMGRKLSCLETVIDISYRTAVADVCTDSARAVLRLLPAVGWTDGVQDRLLAEWTTTLADVLERAAAEGDVVSGREPADMARLLIALYLGLRQCGDLDDPVQFLGRVETCWTAVLPGMVVADRVAYFTQFIRRRTALAIRTAAADSVAATGGTGR